MFCQLCSLTLHKIALMHPVYSLHGNERVKKGYDNGREMSYGNYNGENSDFKALNQWRELPYCVNRYTDGKNATDGKSGSL